MPRLIAPAGDARLPYALVFEWSRVPSAVAYGIQISETERFDTPLLIDDEGSDTAYAVQLPVTGPLWWRVRAFDDRGAPGPWSAVRRVEILPPPLAASVFAVALKPSTVAGGETAEGIVTLLEPAPPGGATVSLSSSGLVPVKLPPRVLFRSGQTAAAFAVTTPRMPGDAAVRITATSRDDMRTATLRITSPRPAARLHSLAVDPAILTAGRTARGTVALTGPARSAVTIELASRDAAHLSVPEAITIPAGASAANFPVATAHDTTSCTVVVTASVDGAVRTAAVELRGAGTMTPLPAPSPLGPPADTVFAYRGAAEFSWSSVAGAASYTLEIAGSGTFGGPPALTRTVPAPLVATSLLSPGAFWWRVRGNDAYGAPGRWSAPRPFRVR